MGASEELANSAALAVTTAITSVVVRIGGLFAPQLFGRTQFVRRLGIASVLASLILVAGSIGAGLAEEKLRALLLVPSALFEELLFRGLPFLILTSGRKLRRPVLVAGVVLTSFVFALLHPSPHISVFFDAFVFSLLAFGMLLATHSIWPAVAFHIVANATVATFPDAIFGGEARISTVIFDAVLGVLILAFLAFWLKRAKWREVSR
ncbi:hypothetical protein LK10_02965 [Sinomonas humi]|uniref:CAAX prenyl protease 2/Lysostaphin resistance protein A-like domain-containing protein n=2 Tax=Sinomonas humi TaxID=1338436 RepID=A0A0B2ASJ2_9MICC|nr:hypothetical protein LK10_02965 [Sinomonas humi]